MSDNKGTKENNQVSKPEAKKEAEEAKAKAFDRVHHTQFILNRIRANKAKRLAKQPKPIVSS